MIRMLFVDDEARVLDGLRQSLRSKRKIWETVFANSGPLGVAELDRGEFDVVISDMRMPGMDGAEFLSIVAARQPRAVRIILSGEMNEGAAARAAGVAHRFVAKPCASEAFVETISRALRLEQLLTSERMRECIGGMPALPSLPRVCALLNQALADKNGSLKPVVQIIEHDIGVAAKVLQLVNSSFFGMSRKSTSVMQAVSYLGVNTLRNLVLAHSLFTELGSGDVEFMEREQNHSLLVARVAGQLLSSPEQVEIAITSGLLHDAGKLVLACRLPDEYAAAAALASSKGIELHEVERERLGVTHAGVGAYLLGLWGLPNEVIDAVAAHHDAWENLQTLDASAAVRIANELARAFEQARSEPGIPPEVLERLCLTDRVAKAWAGIAQLASP
jgi:putative nucleotidyltransferase with HDIG domain